MFRYDHLISELLFRVESPEPLQVPNNFQPFLCDHLGEREADISLQVTFGGQPPYTEQGCRKLSPNVFQKDDRLWERYYWSNNEYIVRQEKVGRGSPCRFFIPAGFSEKFRRQGYWMLLPHDRIVLHASAVIWQGRAYLFSAPSGGGKSTHAALWEKHYGAKLLNGDKVIISVSPEGCRAYGGPVAGSSGIYCNDSAPIDSICIVQKAPYNRLSELTGRMSLLSLYSEAIKSSWDVAFNTRLLELTHTLINITPVYRLECLPERSAVECVIKNQEKR